MDPDVGFWVWRIYPEDEPLRFLAIHEPLVRYNNGNDLAAHRALGCSL